MFDIDSHHKVEGGSNRNFGLVFFVVFVIVALYPLWGGGELRLWALVIAAACLAIALIAPHLLAWPNLIWTRFGMLLGAIVAPLVMMLIFFLVITPIALMLRASGRDPLRRAREPDSESYWMERQAPPDAMRNQF